MADGKVFGFGVQVEYRPTERGVVYGTGVQVEYSQDIRTGYVAGFGVQIEYDVFGVAAVVPAVSSDRGGTPIQLQGEFLEGKSYTVTIDGEPCFGGIAYGYTPACVTGGILDVFTPPLPVGGPYDVVITDVVAAITATLSSAFTIHKSSISSNVLALRSLAAAPRKVGPVSLDDEEV